MERSSRSVLIVDVDRSSLDILGAFCLQRGLVPTVTTSPSEALMWIRRGDPFDLAIIGTTMPGMDGLQFAREVRTHRSRSQLPMLLFTSAEGETAELRKGNEFFVQTLTKPVRHEEMLRALSTVLGGQPAPQEIEPASPRGAETGQRARILIAEDHSVNQKLLLFMLGKLGFTAEVAGNGAEALEASRHTDYDIILMDVQMPVMDGLEATRRILHERGDRRPPKIVALTADAGEGDREKCIRAGMDDYLTKPVQLDALRRVLERLAPGKADEINASGPAKLNLSAVDEPIRSRLKKLGIESKPSLILELLDTYLRHLSEQHDQLQKAVAAGSLQDIELIGHSVKGSGRNFGLERLASVSARMEELAMRGSMEKIRELLPEFSEACQGALASIGKALGTLRAASS